jgi:hypothetical protein
MGPSLTAWTIYGSLFAYWLAAMCWLPGRNTLTFRLPWTVACCLLWIHAAIAFQVYHHWSHAAAVDDTAAQTAAELGRPFGNGIWFSYALLVVWLLDVCRLWTSGQASLIPAESAGDVAIVPRVRRLRTGVEVCVHLYVFFILFNGAVVFEDGPVRWIGLAAVCGLAGRHAVRFAGDDT